MGRDQTKSLKSCDHASNNCLGFPACEVSGENSKWKPCLKRAAWSLGTQRVLSLEMKAPRKGVGFNDWFVLYIIMWYLTFMNRKMLVRSLLHWKDMNNSRSAGLKVYPMGRKVLQVLQRELLFLQLPSVVCLSHIMPQRCGNYGSTHQTWLSCQLHTAEKSPLSQLGSQSQFLGQAAHSLINMLTELWKNISKFVHPGAIFEQLNC
jgi:hypothetical protein